jgi:hypothetical protein
MAAHVRHALIATVLVVSISAAARADCTATIRKATPEEKQSYANARALFLRMAPPAPVGWTATDDKASAPAASAGKFAEIDPITQQIDKLQQEQLKLMGGDGQDATLQALEAQSKKDTSASFRLTVGATEYELHGLSDWASFAAPVGKGYRQTYEDKGVTTSNLIVVVTTPVAAGGTLIFRIDGDPARTDGLLKAIRFR